MNTMNLPCISSKKDMYFLNITFYRVNISPPPQINAKKRRQLNRARRSAYTHENGINIEISFPPPTHKAMKTKLTLKFSLAGAIFYCPKVAVCGIYLEIMICVDALVFLVA